MQSNATNRCDASPRQIQPVQADHLYAAHSRAFFIKRLIKSDCQRVTACLAEHYLMPVAVNTKHLLAYKHRLLELYRYVLSSELTEVERQILLGYLTHSIDSLDDAMARIV